jgi:hypothetical protein
VPQFASRSVVLPSQEVDSFCLFESFVHFGFDKTIQKKKNLFDLLRAHGMSSACLPAAAMHNPSYRQDKRTKQKLADTMELRGTHISAF